MQEDNKLEVFENFEIERVDGMVFAHKYIGNDIDIVIPDEITDILDETFAAYGEKKQYRNLYINSKIKEPIRDDCFENFIVDENNPYMCSVDGVLYSKDKKKLLRYPSFSKRDVYYVLDSVEEINFPAFRRCSLVELFLNDGLKRIENSAFVASEKLERIYIPDSVTFIGKAAFANCSNIKEIRFPSHLDEDIEYFHMFDIWGSAARSDCPDCVLKNVYKNFPRLKDKKLRLCALKGVVIDYEQGIIPPLDV